MHQTNAVSQTYAVADISFAAQEDQTAFQPADQAPLQLAVKPADQPAIQPLPSDDPFAASNFVADGEVSSPDADDLTLAGC